ncbi:MAG TPA: hypothetical protein VKV25_00475, partial [Acidimicrobiales bacterium]|nr:hypothetical protein [Acidimicrobiales bacterium]
WPAVGMARSASLAVRFDDVAVGADGAVGEPGFYTDRVGFWWGASGVAACWWGGARGLLDGAGRLLATGEPGPTEMAAYGSAVACGRSIVETLGWAAAVIDARTDVETARCTALTTREVVHAGCTRMLELVAAAAGARSLCLDPAQSRRAADLYAYLSQHHPGRDAAELGRSLLAASPDP